MYILKIENHSELKESINFILGYNSADESGSWEFIINEDSEFYPNAINYLLDILSDRITELKGIGIDTEDISLWYLYEYEGQCNIEYNPKDLKRMGSMGITLCISCWEKGSQIKL